MYIVCRGRRQRHLGRIGKMERKLQKTMDEVEQVIYMQNAIFPAREDGAN